MYIIILETAQNAANDFALLCDFTYYVYELTVFFIYSRTSAKYWANS